MTSLLDKIEQRERWRQRKARQRARAKAKVKDDPASLLDGRRASLASMTLREEINIFGEYLLGASHGELSARHNISTSTIQRIVLFWKDKFSVRFYSSPAEEPKSLLDW